MRLLRLAAVVPVAGLIACGVPKEEHQRAIDGLNEQLAAAQKAAQVKEAELTEKNQNCDGKLATALDQNEQLVTKVSSMGQNVEQLLGEKGELSQERERLKNEQAALAKEVEELKRMRAAAEARNAEFRKVMDKLKKMTDAGTLSVKVRNGRMVVQMASDVVFPAGAVGIKKEAREAIMELADTLKGFPDRKFQIIGHSDSTPISTARFPSNWELSSQRAIEVVKLMIEAGVPATMLSAAGSAEFDPLVNDDSQKGREANRRVEIVFMPKLDELPGFSPTGATASN
jgi:chemotaxis protein MotB